MNREELKALLPHREPMLLLSEAWVEEQDGVKQARSRCRIQGDEYFLQGHFPGNPVVPGVIQCEMMAQTCCVLLAQEDAAGATPLFTSLNKVKFKQVVRPGDEIEFTCKLTGHKSVFYFAEGQGRVNGKLCVSGEIGFALVKE